MSIFSSIQKILFCFVIVMLVVAGLFWLYLNIQASMQVSAQDAKIRLSNQLPTKIHVGNHLETQAIGALKTKIALDRRLNLPLKGKYLANLSFETETPVKIDIDYDTYITIDTIMPLETTTDLIYQHKLLPKFALKLDIPIKLKVPFSIKRTYDLPIKIMFNGPVNLEFDDVLNIHVKQILTPILNLNDPMTMTKIATFNATMYNEERNTLADLKMAIDLPLKNIHP